VVLAVVVMAVLVLGQLATALQILAALGAVAVELSQAETAVAV
jgi:hypothetical protein